MKSVLRHRILIAAAMGAGFGLFLPLRVVLTYAAGFSSLKAIGSYYIPLFFIPTTGAALFAISKRPFHGALWLYMLSHVVACAIIFAAVAFCTARYRPWSRKLIYLGLVVLYGVYVYFGYEIWGFGAWS